MGAANRYENMNEDDLLVNLESTLSSRPEVMPMPPLPRPPPSRTSRRPSPPESSRDLMMDNHSSRSPKDEGHRGYAATDLRYGEKTRYHAVCRASPRERHQDPPEGR